MKLSSCFRNYNEVGLIKQQSEFLLFIHRTNLTKIIKNSIRILPNRLNVTESLLENDVGSQKYFARTTLSFGGLLFQKFIVYIKRIL